MSASFRTCGARRSSLNVVLRLLAIVVVSAGFSTIAAAQSLKTLCFGPGNPAVEEPPFDLFLAIEEGRIDAKMIVRDPFHARLLLENRSLQAMSVRIPDVLAARPVLAQLGSGFGPPGGQGAVGQTGSIAAPQTVGGAPTASGSRSSPGGGMTNPFFSGNGLNNVFNIAPEQVRTVEIRCLCLEQGKPNPRSAVAYELVPLTEVNDDPKLAEIIKTYGRGEADRDVAQAAAWHLANHLSWNQLAELSQMIALNAERPIFNSQQLRQAKQLVDQAQPQPAKAKVERKAVAVPKL